MNSTRPISIALCLFFFSGFFAYAADGDLPADPMQSASTSDGVRTWLIHLRNGEVIEFEASYNTDVADSPAQFLIDFQRFLKNGTKPAEPKNYFFPLNNNRTDRPSATVLIDLEEIASISMTKLNQ